MKITNLSVTNFLGAAAVDVRTDAPVQLLVGRNGAGKSSIRDAVALALTADLGRVSLKKEAPALIHDGASAAHCEVDTADGDLYGVTITAGGKITDTRSGKDSDPVQSCSG
jgi:DNA repair exonuclease SbcCD ATPase subunit